MEYIHTSGAEPTEEAAVHEGGEGDNSSTIDALRRAERIVQEQERKEADERREKEDPLSGPVDVGGHVDAHLVLKMSAVDAGNGENGLADSDIEPDEDDKRAFVEALSTGGRYERSFSVFGGRLNGVFRARTIGESEAISAYGRRQLLLHVDLGDTGYGDLMKLCLLVSAVKRLGDTDYPEMSEFGNLRYTETSNGVKDPGWVEQLEVWRRKPEVVILAILPEYYKFEAKYYAMTRRAADKNFWNSGPSTEE